MKYLEIKIVDRPEKGPEFTRIARLDWHTVESNAWEGHLGAMLENSVQHLSKHLLHDQIEYREKLNPIQAGKASNLQKK